MIEGSPPRCGLGERVPSELERFGKGDLAGLVARLIPHWIQSLVYISPQLSTGGLQLCLASRLWLKQRAPVVSSPASSVVRTVPD